MIDRSSADMPGIAAQATDWFSLRRSGEMTPAETLAFAAWLEADAAHRVAYEEASVAWQASGLLRDHPAMLAMREAARQVPAPVAHRWRRVAGAAAAAAGLAAIVIGGSGRWGAPGGAELARSTFESAVGQRSTVLLPDGSKLTLDTDSVVIAQETTRERRMDLVRGRAFFDVAKEPGRPFVVYAGEDSVTATGTAFDVRLVPTGIEVNLLRGAVTVDRPARADAPALSAQLVPGQRLVARAESRWAIAPTDGARWLRGQLAFDRAPLREVVAELNRYSHRRIELNDPAIGNTPIVGVFDANDFDGSVQLIADERLARVVARDRKGVVLDRPTENRVRR